MCCHNNSPIRLKCFSLCTRQPNYRSPHFQNCFSCQLLVLHPRLAAWQPWNMRDRPTDDTTLCSRLRGRKLNWREQFFVRFVCITSHPYCKLFISRSQPAQGVNICLQITCLCQSTTNGKDAPVLGLNSASVQSAILRLTSAFRLVWTEWKPLFATDTTDNPRHITSNSTTSHCREKTDRPGKHGLVMELFVQVQQQNILRVYLEALNTLSASCAIHVFQSVSGPR